MRGEESEHTQMDVSMCVIVGISHFSLSLAAP